MTPILYDTHAHLDYPEFAGDLPGILTRAGAAGVARIIAIGTDLASSRRAVELADLHPGIHAVVGWHPGQAMEAPADIRPALRELAAHPKVVAIGETGLDFHRLPSSQGGTLQNDANLRARQAELFEQQLEVAAECGLNCVIHQRGCLSEVLTLMRPYSGRVRGQFHCFVDDAAAMHQVLDLGGVVSFTGILTFKNGATVRETLAATPADRFMVETDSPYLAPVPYRGQRCEPAYVRETAVVAAGVRSLSLEELGSITCRTAHQFFPRLG
ncbi:MAG: TatD family hydrolase [Limisphaerales bacterium]